MVRCGTPDRAGVPVELIVHLFCISRHYVPFGGGQEACLVTCILLYASVRQRKGSTCQGWNSRDFRLAEGIAFWMQQYSVQQFSHLLSHKPTPPPPPEPACRLMEHSDRNTSGGVNTESVFAWPFQWRGGNSYAGKTKKKRARVFNGWKSTCLWAAAVCWTQLLFSVLLLFLYAESSVWFRAWWTMLRVSTHINAAIGVME